MLGYLVLCDKNGKVNKVIKSIPAGLVSEEDHLRQMFAESEEEKLSALFGQADGAAMSQSLKLARQEAGTASVAVGVRGEQVCFLMGRLDETAELTPLLELYLSAAEEWKALQELDYESSYCEIQKVNNQLINYQRALTKTNERLKMLLAEAREAKSTIEILERDALTNLYTQSAFLDRAERMLKSHPEVEFDIIVVDVERFKMVNDAFGTEEGDKVLVGLTNCLLSIRIEGLSLLTRARADKFYILTPRMENHYKTLADNIEFFCANYPIPMRLQIKFGIYQVTDRNIGVIQMCDRALLATNSIKGSFDQIYAFYDASIREKMILEQKIINHMLEALEKEEFQIYLQPKVEITTGRLIGAESLVRWVHPELGMIQPGDFIPVFEKNGFIYSLDIFVWRKSCETMSEWKKRGNYIPISVNVSRVDTYHKNLPEVLLRMTEENDLEPAELHLEITESAYVADSYRLLPMIEKLKQLGFVIEMDDFGHGYSSLNTLSELPIDVLKMDLEFLRDKKNSIRRQQIMKFVINLAGELRLQVIAEGAENEEQVALLKTMGCQYAQGYYYGKPMPRDVFYKKYLEEGREENL